MTKVKPPSASALKNTPSFLVPSLGTKYADIVKALKNPDNDDEAFENFLQYVVDKRELKRKMEQFYSGDFENWFWGLRPQSLTWIDYIDPSPYALSALYFHISSPQINEGGNLTIYKTFKDMLAEKTTNISPGRYYKLVFPTATDQEVELFTVSFKNQYIEEEWTLVRGTEEKHFVRAYSLEPASSHGIETSRYKKDINDSCMQKEGWDYGSPVAAYASGEFEIFYLVNRHAQIGGRVIVHWPSLSYGPFYVATQKCYRILKDMLNALNITAQNGEEKWLGAQMKKILGRRGSNYYLMPYVDNYSYLDPDWRITNRERLRENNCVDANGRIYPAGSLTETCGYTDFDKGAWKKVPCTHTGKEYYKFQLAQGPDGLLYSPEALSLLFVRDYHSGSWIKKEDAIEVIIRSPSGLEATVFSSSAWKELHAEREGKIYTADSFYKVKVRNSSGEVQTGIEFKSVIKEQNGVWVKDESQDYYILRKQAYQWRFAWSPCPVFSLEDPRKRFKPSCLKTLCTPEEPWKEAA